MRDVMKEHVARELFCPLRAAYCRGDACMAWVVSWENNNEGYCSAFRATHEQEIGEGWEKYGRRIMDSRKKLFARLKLAERERDAARADLERFKRNWFSSRAELEVSERAQEQLRAELERAQADAAILRKALDIVVRDFMPGPDSGCDSRGVDNSLVEGAAALAGVTTGADLQAEVTRLREIKRLAKAYRAAVMERRAHKGIDPNTDDSPLGTKWGRRMEELTTAKREAGEKVFDALAELEQIEKEETPNV